MIKYIRYIILLCIFLFTNSISSNASDSFAWLNRNNNLKIFNEIESAFAKELRPDIPEEVKPIVPYLYKYIEKIGLYGTSCLVIIGYREHRNDSAEHDHFKAFSYDRASGKKSETMPKDSYYQWSLIGLHTFEPTPTPDVVFKYYNCLECEKVELLSSFKFNQKENRWDVRVWPDNDPHLLIGSDIQYGDDDWEYDCLYSIGDINLNEFSDILIHCKIKGMWTNTVISDAILLYTIKKGKSYRIVVEDEKQRKEMDAILCKGQNSSLCQ